MSRGAPARPCASPTSKSADFFSTLRPESRGAGPPRPRRYKGRKARAPPTKGPRRRASRPYCRAQPVKHAGDGAGLLARQALEYGQIVVYSHAGVPTPAGNNASARTCLKPAALTFPPGCRPCCPTLSTSRRSCARAGTPAGTLARTKSATSAPLSGSSTPHRGPA